MVYARTRARTHTYAAAAGGLAGAALGGESVSHRSNIHTYIYIFIRRGLFRWRARFHDYSGGRTLCRNRSHRKVQSLGRVYTYIIICDTHTHIRRTRITATRTRHCTTHVVLNFLCALYVYILYCTCTYIYIYRYIIYHHYHRRPHARFIYAFELGV